MMVQIPIGLAAHSLEFQSAMRAIRYDVSVIDRINQAANNLKFQSAMRAIRYDGKLGYRR